MKSASTRGNALIGERVHAKLLMQQPSAHSKGRAGHVSCEVFEPKAVFATAFTGVLGGARTVRDHCYCPAASRVRLARLAAEAVQARTVA
jgi:hypothetical protein